MKKSLLFFAGLLILLLTNCSVEDYGSGGNAPGNGNGSLTVNLKIPGSTINTYASVDAVGGEEEVHTLYALFFDPTNDGSGIFKNLIDLSPANDGVYTSGQTIEITIPEGSGLNNKDAYSLFFIANPTYYISSYQRNLDEWRTFFTGKTENEVKQLRIDIQTNDPQPSDASYYGDTPFVQDNLMMTGSINKETDQDMITAELTRIVSRFDVANDAKDYTLETVSIWNAFPEQTIGEINFSDFSIERIKRFYGLKVKENKIVGGLYTYENFVAAPEQNDQVSTCLILGIRNETNGNLGYYRINASADGRPQQLRRNYAYSFTIKSVKGAGEGSEEDAYKSSKNELNVQVNEWNVDDQGCIQYDADNILAIATNNVTFNRLGGDREYKVFTSGEGSLIISDQYLPAGITAELKNGVIYISAEESEFNKSGYVEFQFGKLKATMYITQTGEVEQMLEVSHTSLPMFDNDPQSPDDISELVTVTSSGPWTATIYNDAGAFVFGGGSNPLVTKGENLETFTIQVTADNTNIAARYAFIHVTLDENPQISAVVIISQNGLGGIDLDPDHDAVVFDANGDYTTAPTDYTFTVDTQNNEEWDFAIYGTHKNYFTAEKSQDGTQVSITSKGINPESIELSAQLRVYLKENPAIYKEVQITQQAHSLTVNPETVGSIASTGGSSDEITVTSSADWEATITVQGNDAYFNGQTGVTVIPGESGESFRVTFPPLTNGGIAPEAIVTITIPGTNIKKTIIVKQSALAGQIINIQNYSTLYGYLTTENTYYRYNYIEQLWQSMTSPDWFGADGTVFMGGWKFIDFAESADPSADIYVLNGFNGDRSQGNAIRTWLEASEHRVLLALSDDRTSTMLNYMNLTGYTGSGGTGNNVVKTNFARTINTDDTYTVDNNKLYDYLFRSGPFTEGVLIEKNQIKLLPYDASNNCLTAWPPTMIPLMLDENDPTRLILGVDPTLRIVYTGEMDLFGTMGVSTIAYTENGVTYTGVNNYYGGPYSENNLKFLNNLIAWMTNVVLLGDEFTNQFKVGQ